MLQRKFDLSPLSIGTMFMVEGKFCFQQSSKLFTDCTFTTLSNIFDFILGATYAIFSLLWGFFLDKKFLWNSRWKYFPLVIGALGVIFGYILLFDSSNIYVVGGNNFYYILLSDVI